MFFLTEKCFVAIPFLKISAPISAKTVDHHCSSGEAVKTLVFWAPLEEASEQVAGGVGFCENGGRGGGIQGEGGSAQVP